ncbi:triose-phosphate isomerase [Candidatus Falkowbacteria bacterium CG10_big_fil_rev_8_21_14_0_10_37_14]|uniref:Triosephosphate isomerase n=1 Tax=Candidatus Falkowbacteria bacterium CG10_big_fil_rev_8_21_14_0_10_37_14 TaxID=1974561 RepID=A0A2M6WTN3_9BACT|nr:triose-phosphate isomerase [Candidatus Falkowbacteria bacterium]PIT96163.1 MAG: triose-phosphate isomerase [Candidatus Falkowbacteria bacterium CG10_big_fil_rev_8_21_14_0_10_37_14]
MKKIIIGNWKMNLGLKASLKLAMEYKKNLKGTNSVVVAGPSEFALADVVNILKGSGVLLAAQNVFWQNEGAYTGEVSVKTLEEIGCRYVLIGHSERRQYLGESCRIVNQKIKAVLILTQKISPVLCVGESLSTKQAGKSKIFVSGQLQRALVNVKSFEAARLVIAYEPIWAIGTGKTATEKDVLEMHGHIRVWLSKRFGVVAGKIPILYGGSVKATVAIELLATPDVDGLLVGGASLLASEMKKIANIK